MQPAKRRGSQLESSSSTDSFGITAGRLGRPTGLAGFLGLYAEPEDLVYFEPGTTVRIRERTYVVRAVRRGPRGAEVAFEGVESRDGAEAIRGEAVFVSERRALEGSEYWPEELIGLDVRPGGGRIERIEHGPAQDRLVVARDGSEFEVPFVDELVPVVDLEGGYVEIVEIEGLT